jgi:colicin import membrane protein
MKASTSLIACSVLLLAGAAQAASGTGSPPSAAPAAGATQAEAEKPVDAGRLRQADAAAQKMAEHAKAAAARSKAAIGDWSQRTAQLIVRLAHKADEAAREAARRWKVEADAARGVAREDIARAQLAVDQAASATQEALNRAKETAKADVQRSKEEAEKAAAAAREAFEKAETATREAARAAKEAASKALKRPAKGA